MNFPHVQNSEPFSSTLERDKRKFFQTFPVIKVMAASNSGGECSLDTFQFLDVSDFCRTPER